MCRLGYSLRVYILESERDLMSWHVTLKEIREILSVIIVKWQRLVVEVVQGERKKTKKQKKKKQYKNETTTQGVSQFVSDYLRVQARVCPRKNVYIILCRSV